MPFFVYNIFKLVQNFSDIWLTLRFSNDDDNSNSSYYCALLGLVITFRPFSLQHKKYYSFLCFETHTYACVYTPYLVSSQYILKKKKDKTKQNNLGIRDTCINLGKSL